MKVDYQALMQNLLACEYGTVLRIVAFNPHEGWSRDASEYIARELERRVAAEGREVSEGLQNFTEGQLGRKIGRAVAAAAADITRRLSASWTPFYFSRRASRPAPP